MHRKNTKKNLQLRPENGKKKNHRNVHKSQFRSNWGFLSVIFPGDCLHFFSQFWGLSACRCLDPARGWSDPNCSLQDHYRHLSEGNWFQFGFCLCKFPKTPKNRFLISTWTKAGVVLDPVLTNSKCLFFFCQRFSTPWSESRPPATGLGKPKIPKSAGESAGKSAGKQGTAGRTARNSAGRPLSLEKQRNGTAPSSLPSCAACGRHLGYVVDWIDLFALSHPLRERSGSVGCRSSTEPSPWRCRISSLIHAGCWRS